MSRKKSLKQSVRARKSLTGTPGRSKTRISPADAKRMAVDLGWDFSKDFHAQGSMADVQELLAIAKLRGYRQSKGASGSKGRSFFYYLKRVK